MESINTVIKLSDRVPDYQKIRKEREDDGFCDCPYNEENG